MYHSLIQTFPGITVISEETSQDCDKVVIENVKNSFKDIDGYDITDDIVDINDITIWIDPLDATKEFTGKNRFRFRQSSKFQMFGMFYLLMTH